MLTYAIGGLVVGFALGWGIYWYLGQGDRRQWRTERERPPLVTGAVIARVWEQTRLLGERAWPLSSSAFVRQVEVVDGEIVEEGGEGQALSTPLSPPADSLEKQGQREQAKGGMEEPVKAYCPVCHQRQPIQNARRVATRTGHTAVRGTCGICGGELFAFIK